MKFTYFQRPILSFILRKLDQDINKFGVQQAMVNLLKRSQTRFSVSGLNEETKKILKKNAVVLISNHINTLDPAVVFATSPAREDSYLIVASDFLNLSKNLDKHLIPVYINHHYEEENYKENKKYYYYLLKTLRLLHPLPKFTAEEEHQKNIESIARASRILEKGGLVIIFPEGGNSNEGWMKGIGHMLKGVKKSRTIFIVNVFIRGDSDLDFLRIIPGGGMLLPSLEINYSKPKIANELFEKDVRVIVKDLADNYKNWSSRLK